MSRFTLTILSCSLLLLSSADLIAQEKKAEERTRSRPLAPGILTVIKPRPEAEEATTQQRQLVEIVKARAGLKFTPNFDSETRTIFARANRIHLRREIWNLEFAFKPMRIVEVDVPLPNGKFQKKTVWYMVYRIRYLGRELHPDAKTDKYDKKTFEIKEADYNNRWFIPTFVLEAHKVNKAYHDQIIPSAIGLIQEREMQGQKLLNSVQVTKERIHLSTADTDRPIWAVATWENVDPATDYLSVYVTGLTNAYQYLDNPDFAPGDKASAKRKFKSKTLRLNFFRWGDSVREAADEKEIVYGIPTYKSQVTMAKVLAIYGLQERLDHLWLYR